MVYSSILRGDTSDTQLCLCDVPIILQIIHHAASTIPMQLSYNHHQGEIHQPPVQPDQSSVNIVITRNILMKEVLCLTT